MEHLKDWKAGTFRPCYYFIGEEASAKAEALAQLKEAFQADTFNYAEFTGEIDPQAAAVVSECLTIPVFADKRLVVVNSVKVGAAAKAVLAEYLGNPSKTTTLVLMSDERRPDPKDPLVKLAAVLSFSPLDERAAEAKLIAEAKAAGKTLSREAAEALVGEAGTDWAILRQELEKTILYCAEGKEISLEIVTACLGYRKQADPFALTRLIQGRDLKHCLAHLQRMLSDGKKEDQAFKALNQINSTVLKQVKAKQLLKKGLPSFQVGKMTRLWDNEVALVGRFHETRLRRDLKRCLRAEAALKSKAWLDPAMEVEQLVVDICRK